MIKTLIHYNNKCRLTQKEVAAPVTPLGVNVHVLSEANISPVINDKTFLPVIVVVIIRINTIEHKITFQASEKLAFRLPPNHILFPVYLWFAS